MKTPPKVSIIIPCREIDAYTKQCMRECLKLDYDNFDIILLPDSGSNDRFPKTKIMPTGPVLPSIKRNAAAKKTSADVLAFIDSDAYPEKSWLRNALEVMEKRGAEVTGGPNLLPPDDGMLQKASDDVLSSRIAAGHFAARYSMTSYREVNELPSCNLLVKRKLFNRIGGFDASLLTAEDAKLCFEARKLGKKIVYDPGVIVYHHRRPLFRPHLQQIWVYGRDKAHIVKSFFSKDKIFYFLPSIFVLALVSGFMLSFNPWLQIPLIRNLYTGAVLLYVVVVAAASLLKSPKRFWLVFPGIILTHISYGVGFLCGLIARNKGSKK